MSSIIPSRRLPTSNPNPTSLSSCIKLPKRNAKCKMISSMQVLIQVIWFLQHPSFNDSNTVYTNKAFSKQGRQVELQESFVPTKSSYYNEQLQAKNFIIIYSNR